EEVRADELGRIALRHRLGLDLGHANSVARLPLIVYIVDLFNDIGGQLVSSTTDSRRRWSALALIVTAQFMVILDVAIVNGALLAPAALSLLMMTFAEGRERNLALGIYGAASGTGGAAGVLLGGVLTSYLSWSWIFFVNVPVGVGAALLAPVLLRESRPELA